MIQNTFCILNGVGERIEKRLWKNGILTWSDFINAGDIEFINREKKTIYDDRLLSMQTEFEKGNAEYFASSIRRREHWRLFERFRDSSVCLDIETNGFTPYNGGYVTMVGLYNGFDYKCFIRGLNLNVKDLQEELSRYSLLITYFGAGFDVPFLLGAMNGLNFRMPHFDTCFCSRKVGYKGGFKSLEAALGIRRDHAVEGMNGYDAVKLWEHFCKGSREALDVLTIYNREDTVNLFRAADFIYEELKAQTGIEEYLQN